MERSRIEMNLRLSYGLRNRLLEDISTFLWQVGHRPDTPVSHGSKHDFYVASAVLLSASKEKKSKCAKLTWKQCPHSNNRRGSGSDGGPSLAVGPSLAIGDTGAPLAPGFFFLGGSSKSIKQTAHTARFPSSLTNGSLDFSHRSSHVSSFEGNSESSDSTPDGDVDKALLMDFL